MAGGPVGTAGVVLLNPVVDRCELSETGLELLNIGDLPVEGSHVAEVVKVNDGHGRNGTAGVIGKDLTNT